MKKYFLYVLLFTCYVGIAQDFQGIAVYEAKTDVDIRINSSDGPNPEMDKALKEQLKKMGERTYTLYFDKVASVYEEEQKLSQPSVSAGGMNINFHDGSKKYRNIKENKWLEEQEVMSREFLVVDSLTKWDWKLVNETKKIGNYNCYKATATYTVVDKEFRFGDEEQEKGKKEKAVNLLGDDKPKEVTITAWYTPEIPVSHGPGEYWGLPGLILEVDTEKTTILCSKITLNPKDKFEIKELKKGKKVSREELEEIVQEKMKEMMENNRSRPGETSKTIIIGG